MDGDRFDDLSRMFAAGVSRRTALKGAAAGLRAALGLRATAGAQVTQAHCGNVTCARRPDKCKPGCVCCVAANGNSRCVPAGSCSFGTEACPPGQTYCADLGRCAACCTAATCPASTGPCLAAACQNGTCGFAFATEGGACDDGNACTVGDTCRGGVCQGGTAVVCTTDNLCLTAACDPGAGCVTTPKALGASCDDATLCNGSEACDGAGTCVPGIPVTCAPPVPCQEAGVCDAATGTCIYANKPNGDECDTGNPCTADTCQSGACVPGADVVTPTCATPDQCQEAGVCDPTTGECAYADTPDTTPCNDGDACTRNDACQAGVCAGSPIAGCTACETFADCPRNEENTCEVPTCTNGVCGRRFLDAGFPCANSDPCVEESICEPSVPRLRTICQASKLSTRAACVDPCNDVSECADRAGQCQEMACVPDAFVGNGGCQVVADADANGTSCTREISGFAGQFEFRERECITDGTCQSGACQGDVSYTCSPVSGIMCCFGQKDGCGKGNGASCGGNAECCSDRCESGRCVG